MIMLDSVTIMRQRQLAARREMDRRSILLKQVHFDSGIPMPTLSSYFPHEGAREPAVMPMSALYQIIEGNALPADLLSLLMPAGWQIVRAPEELDHDDVERACRDFLSMKGDAHHPESPAGREISDCEARNLNVKVVQLRGTVRA